MGIYGNNHFANFTEFAKETMETFDFLHNNVLSEICQMTRAMVERPRRHVMIHQIDCFTFISLFAAAAAAVICLIWK